MIVQLLQNQMDEHGSQESLQLLISMLNIGLMSLGCYVKMEFIIIAISVRHLFMMA